MVRLVCERDELLLEGRESYKQRSRNTGGILKERLIRTLYRRILRRADMVDHSGPFHAEERSRLDARQKELNGIPTARFLEMLFNRPYELLVVMTATTSRVDGGPDPRRFLARNVPLTGTEAAVVVTAGGKT